MDQCFGIQYIIVLKKYVGASISKLLINLKREENLVNIEKKHAPSN